MFCLQAFRFALEVVGARPETSLFLDDSKRNILAAKAIGMQTILVRTVFRR